MMSADYLTTKEIDLLKGDIEANKASLLAQQISVANTLKNGLGEAMIKDLKKPQKSKRTFKEKIKGIFVKND